MTQRLRYAWLPPAIERGALVVTSSRRLARELGNAYNAHMQAAGHATWATPAIRHWQDWLSDTLADAERADLPQVLDAASATMLWEQSLDRTSRENLLSIAGVVRHAQSAWTRLNDWQIADEQVALSAASRDEHWFVRAARSYAQALAQGGWIDSASLAAECSRIAADLPWPTEIVHAGFDRVTPALSGLFDTLAEQGTTVAAAPVPETEPAVCLRDYADDECQWRAAGHWARSVLEREPHASVAIVAPDLESDAARIARLVREGFAPGWQLGEPRYRNAVNVSYGRRLGEFPAIRAALQCLRFAAGGLRGAELGVLLQSRFISVASPGTAARLDLLLRTLPDRSWTPDALLALFDDKCKNDDVTEWQQHAAVLAALQADGNSRFAPTAWAERFDRELAKLGWPATGAPDSDEFQLLNRWRQLLNQLARLDRVQPRMSLSEAVGRLGQIAGDTVYQPESSEGALTVMGLLETAGHEFDYLWVGGMDASRWPPAGNPLALVNRALQRDAGMPDATPADTLEFARRVLQRLQRSAGEVCFAWARTEADSEVGPSPLLDPQAPLASDAGDPGWFATQVLASGRVHRVTPDAAPPVEPGERISGGAYTVQCMREEPFAAFVKGRLAAGTLDPYTPGLTPRQRGNLVHDGLHALLSERPSRQAMAGWQDVARRSEQAAFQAQLSLARHADAVLRQLLQLEKNRLQRLLEAFVALECEREDFVIDTLEHTMPLHYGPVRLSLRIDRIDRFADDTLLIADYKTGAPKTFLDGAGNPKTVQLSTYACAETRPVGALAFINVDSRGLGYDGAGHGFRSGRKPVADEQWDAVLADWRNEVEVLLTRFAAGELGINTVQPADNRRPLAILSRVEELRRDD